MSCWSVLYLGTLKEHLRSAVKRDVRYIQLSRCGVDTWKKVFHKVPARHAACNTRGRGSRSCAGYSGAVL